MSQAPSTGKRRSAANGWLRALEMTSRLAETPQRILPTMVDELAQRFGDAPALLHAREQLTYAGLAARANQYARWALDVGLMPGDAVCLLMANRPEYFAIWLGISRVGGIVALLNTNLTGPSLAHCIAIAAPKHVIVAAELFDTLTSAMLDLSSFRLWTHGPTKGDPFRIDQAVATFATDPLRPSEDRRVTLADRALYIYTSGTTGLPKAANVSHHRVMTWSHWFAGMAGTTAEDRMYNCLPMYHSVGGVVAIGAVLVSGGAVVLSEKFSGRQFWHDVARWECTIFQYIGELCRYLVNTPPSEWDRRHRLRLCCGNGLRADVWRTFQERFEIPRILEFYAATEGNFSLFNLEGRVGAIGKIPAFLAHRFPAALVKFDVATGMPLRGDDGLCIRCARNDVGEAIGRIAAHDTNGTGRFEGYTNEADSQTKVLRNVFAAGDAWLRTGDLMRQDESGFFYFVDRVGDTFRWKGENVATSEVSEAICACPGVLEANVYGVAVAGTEGRAGMAALVVDATFDLACLGRHLEALPDYARPLFLRLQRDLEVTTTFKHQKQTLVAEGYDPTRIGDPLYFNQGDTFVPLDATLFEQLNGGAVRV